VKDTLATLQRSWTNVNRVFLECDPVIEHAMLPPSGEQQHQHSQLGFTEAVLRSVLNSVPVGLVLAESETRRVINVNSKAEELLGFSFKPNMTWTPEGWNASDCDGRHIKPFNLPLTRLLRTGDATDSEARYLKRSDHSEVWLRVTTVPIVLRNGERLGGVLVIEDIDEETSERQRVAELSRSFTRLLAETYGSCSTLSGVANVDLRGGDVLRSSS